MYTIEKGKGLGFNEKHICVIDDNIDFKKAW
jgi:hypothetical protein